MSLNANEFVVSGALANLAAEIDDFCGTGPRPHIPHVPWLREVLVGVAVARLCAGLEESPVRAQLLKISSELVKAGVARAGSNPMPGLPGGG